MTNSDFRLFLADLNVLGRQVFRDSAFALSSAAEEAGKVVEPSASEQAAIQAPGKDASNGVPTADDVQAQVAEVSDVVAAGAKQVAHDAAESATEKLRGDEGDTLVHRLQQAVVKLRKRPDYDESVSTLSLLIKRYAALYSRAVEDTLNAAEQDVQRNPETDRALKNFWTFITSFGDGDAWKQLEAQFEKVLRHQNHDPQFESLTTDVANSLQDLLTDPSFFEKSNAQRKFDELRQKSKQVGSDGSSLRQDVDDLLAQAQRTFDSVLHDGDVA
ncbi:MAG: hypothetical protein INR71_09805, partial [Terriglobus roseus]|nr:hypothetical protein [Terriglobus roseus]